MSQAILWGNVYSACLGQMNLFVVEYILYATTLDKTVERVSMF